MGVPYNYIIRNVAIRINALTNATQPDTLEAAYIINPLTAADVQESAIFSFTSIKDSILNIEQKLAEAIAEVRDHPWRTNLISQTSALISGSTMPPTDENGLSIIGLYGQITDETDGRQLFEQPAQVIERRLATAAIWKVPVYWYSISDSIIHTRTSVRVQVCVWDYLERQAAIDSNDDMLLPDVLAEAMICGTMALLSRDDEWQSQAEVYGRYFLATLEAIHSGSTVLPVEEAA